MSTFFFASWYRMEPISETMTTTQVPGIVKVLGSILSRPSQQVQDYAAHQFRILQRNDAKRLALHRDRSSPFCMSAAESREGDERNRYSNIIPFDYNRIKLKGGVCDYINASMIEAPYDIPRKYIATQGPLQNTIGDFWRMVVEQNTRVIVCLSPEMENNREKCARYWPVGSEEKEIDNCSVVVQNVAPEETNMDADCIVRRIKVTIRLDSDGDDKQQSGLTSTVVTQLQFLGWADFSVPQTTHEVIALSRLADQIQPPDAGPMVVHCSAGCGRTGTFCVVNSGSEWMRRMMRSPENHQQKIDPVFALVDAFREQRTTMVQASSQYLFCYKALLDVFQQEFGTYP